MITLSSDLLSEMRRIAKDHPKLSLHELTVSYASARQGEHNRGEASHGAGRAASAIARGPRRRRMGPRYWHDVATGLLNQAGQILPERDVDFLANVQQTCHRGISPTDEQRAWIRSIQAKVEGAEHVS